MENTTIANGAIEPTTRARVRRERLQPVTRRLGEPVGPDHGTTLPSSGTAGFTGQVVFRGAGAPGLVAPGAELATYMDVLAFRTRRPPV